MSRVTVFSECDVLSHIHIQQILKRSIVDECAREES